VCERLHMVLLMEEVFKEVVHVISMYSLEWNDDVRHEVFVGLKNKFRGMTR